MILDGLTESIVEDTTLEWFGDLSYAVERELNLAPREPHGSRGCAPGCIIMNSDITMSTSTISSTRMMMFTIMIMIMIMIMNMSTATTTNH